ncbi:hypothetical protein CRE_20827 [Caenorhabditis remanei]|uniref:SPK domain-containing protein n=1 Tax=Caenorhabditis remanei TaxID=31234 RepID=E3MV00_CAERE|nr:hypothetical protein CRE_20827 [Caenorhabditis remanei]
MLRRSTRVPKPVSLTTVHLEDAIKEPKTPPTVNQDSPSSSNAPLSIPKEENQSSNEESKPHKSLPQASTSRKVTECFSEKDSLAIFRFVLSRIRSQNPAREGRVAKRRVELNSMVFWEKCREFVGADRDVHGYRTHFFYLLRKLHEYNGVSMDDKVDIYYALDIRVDPSIREKLVRKFEVEFDEEGIITGSLLLHHWDVVHPDSEPEDEEDGQPTRWVTIGQSTNDTRFTEADDGLMMQYVVDKINSGCKDLTMKKVWEQFKKLYKKRLSADRTPITYRLRYLRVLLPNIHKMPLSLETKAAIYYHTKQPVSEQFIRELTREIDVVLRQDGRIMVYPTCPARIFLHICQQNCVVGLKSKNRLSLLKAPQNSLAAQAFSEQEDAQIWEHILNKCKLNQGQKFQVKMNGWAFWRQFIEEVGSQRPWQVLSDHFTKDLMPNMRYLSCDVKSKLELYYSLSRIVEEDVLFEFEQIATVTLTPVGAIQSAVGQGIKVGRKERPYEEFDVNSLKLVTDKKPEGSSSYFLLEDHKRFPQLPHVPLVEEEEFPTEAKEEELPTLPTEGFLKTSQLSVDVKSEQLDESSGPILPVEKKPEDLLLNSGIPSKKESVLLSMLKSREETPPPKKPAPKRLAPSHCNQQSPAESSTAPSNSTPSPPASCSVAQSSSTPSGSTTSQIPPPWPGVKRSTPAIYSPRQPQPATTSSGQSSSTSSQPTPPIVQKRLSANELAHKLFPSSAASISLANLAPRTPVPYHPTRFMAQSAFNQASSTETRLVPKITKIIRLVPKKSRGPPKRPTPLPTKVPPQYQGPLFAPPRNKVAEIVKPATQEAHCSSDFGRMTQNFSTMRKNDTLPALCSPHFMLTAVSLYGKELIEWKAPKEPKRKRNMPQSAPESESSSAEEKKPEDIHLEGSVVGEVKPELLDQGFVPQEEVKPNVDEMLSSSSSELPIKSETTSEAIRFDQYPDTMAPGKRVMIHPKPINIRSVRPLNSPSSLVTPKKESETSGTNGSQNNGSTTSLPPIPARHPPPPYIKPGKREPKVSIPTLSHDPKPPNYERDIPETPPPFVYRKRVPLLLTRKERELEEQLEREKREVLAKMKSEAEDVTVKEFLVKQREESKRNNRPVIYVPPKTQARIMKRTSDVVEPLSLQKIPRREFSEK